MCLEVYLGSQHELSLVEWIESDPRFYTRRLGAETVPELVKGALQSDHVYGLQSFMGCSCGLDYGPHTILDDDHEVRMQDVRAMANYLQEHVNQNQLKIFATWWTNIPEHFAEKQFVLSAISEKEFEFEENTILTVVK